jgi:soluble lytic murein transglycosylase-like protein
MPRRNGYLLGLMVFLATIPHVANRPVGLHFHIKEVATRYDVSEDLIAAIIEIESQFNPRAVSRRGARGLMQLMPATAARLGVGNPFDPRENIEGGVRHLRRLLDRFDNDLPLALAAYHAGEQAVIDHRGIPPYRQTRQYVNRILRVLDRAPRDPVGVTSHGRWIW